MCSSLLESVFLAFIPEISLGATQVDNLGAAIPIFLHLSTLLAIVGITDSWSTADRASPLEASEVALVTNLDQSAWAHIGVTYNTLAVTLLAKAANGHSGLLTAEDQVRVMLSHF